MNSHEKTPSLAGQNGVMDGRADTRQAHSSTSNSSSNGSGNRQPDNPDTSTATDWNRLAEQFATDCSNEKLSELANQLGIPSATLRAIGYGWDAPHGRWTCPERNANGDVIGIATRNGAFKRCVTGSARGLIYAPDNITKHSDTLVITEGGSDAAAAITLGCRAVGFSQAIPTAPQLQDLAVLIDRYEINRVVIVFDADTPGINGSRKVADYLADSCDCEILICAPPFEVQDLRDALQSLITEGLDTESESGCRAAGDRVLVELTHKAERVPRTEPVEAEGVTTDAPDVWVAFPTSELPRAAADLVRQGAGALQVDEGMLAPLTLGAMAAAIGNARVVELCSSWREPSILWTVVVSPSGTGKSPALELVTKPLDERDDHSFVAYEQAMAEHEQRLFEHKASKSKAPPPKPPVCERVTTTDPTFDSFAPMLKVSPRGMLLACDELSSWFGGFSRYSNSSRRDAHEASRWMPLHRASRMKIDRKTSPHLHVRRAALSIAGLIQPGILARSLSETDFDMGLVARILLAMPPTPTRKWSNSSGLSRSVEGGYHKMINGLLDLDMTTSEHGEPEPRSIPLDEGAQDIWADFYDRLNVDKEEADDRGRAMLSKIEGTGARLALIVHMGRVASGEDVQPDVIDADSMNRGVTLANWFRYEAERLYNRLGETEQESERRALSEYVRARGPKGVTAGQLAKSGPRAFRGDHQAAKMALDDLASSSGFRYESPAQNGSGRPKAPRVVATPETAPESP